MPAHVMIPINNCKKCPHCDTKLTKGYGHATDYICNKVDRLIAGYVEWPSQEPQDSLIPEWCPFAMGILYEI